MSADEQKPQGNEKETSGDEQEHESDAGSEHADKGGEVKGSAETAMLTVRVVNQQGEAVKFRTKRTSSIKRLLDAYCERKHLRKKEMRFRYDGHAIADNATAESLGMEDDDLIEVFTEQVGGNM